MLSVSLPALVSELRIRENRMIDFSNSVESIIEANHSKPKTDIGALYFVFVFLL